MRQEVRAEGSSIWAPRCSWEPSERCTGQAPDAPGKQPGMWFRPRDSSSVLDTDARLIPPLPSALTDVWQPYHRLWKTELGYKWLVYQRETGSDYGYVLLPRDWADCISYHMWNIIMNLEQLWQQLMMDIELWLIFTNRERTREMGESHGTVNNSLVSSHRKAQMERKQQRDKERKKEGQKYKEEILKGKHLSISVSVYFFL